MSGINLTRPITFIAVWVLLTACQPLNFDTLKKAPIAFFNSVENSTLVSGSKASIPSDGGPLLLGDILEGSLANNNLGSDFASSLKYAVDTDPVVVSKRSDIDAKLAALGVSKAKKEFQIGTTLYGGLEDITDNEKGVAIAINASRLVFDGGKLKSQIDSAQFEAEAAKMELLATIDKRAYDLCQKWLELEKYKALQIQIDKRLAVLDPLIEQLEQVAQAGIGDVSKVTAAQRTVSAIRVEQTSIAEGFARAQLEFSNSFGFLKKEIAFDYDGVSVLVPKRLDKELVQNSPLLLSQYFGYQASVANVKSLRAKAGFDIGFEARAMRPFAGSGYDSDESVGLVGRKTLFNGGMLESEIAQAEALTEVRLEQIKATYREGSRAVQTAMQNIKSMKKAILVARENAKLTADEIVYLKQQLIIGGSTLDSVLSAEARLYEAESKEIKFLTEKYKSELLVTSTLGLLSKSFGF